MSMTEFERDAIILALEKIGARGVFWDDSSFLYVEHTTFSFFIELSSVSSSPYNENKLRHIVKIVNHHIPNTNFMDVLADSLSYLENITFHKVKSIELAFIDSKFYEYNVSSCGYDIELVFIDCCSYYIDRRDNVVEKLRIILANYLASEVVNEICALYTLNQLTNNQNGHHTT